MRSPARAPALLLVGSGLLVAIAGAAGIFAGLTLAERIHALLPPVTADAAAIGGAATAVGAVLLLAGAGQVALGVALRRPRPWSLLLAAIACAVLAVLALGWSVAALVSVLAGSAAALGLTFAALALAGLAAAYAWSAGRLVRLWRASGGRA